MACKLTLAGTLTAFDLVNIGTKVIHPTRFIELVREVIEEFDFERQTVPGQAVLSLPPEAVWCVSCGVGRRVHDSGEYLARPYRGTVGLFLRRQHAAKAESVSAVVYTKDAYLQDPDVEKDRDEFNRIQHSNATHILVAVLAAAGPNPPVTFERFVKNQKNFLIN